MSSKDKYVKETLTMPSELPLFNYNINFDGLRGILEGVNIKTNNNQQSIKQILQVLQTKLPSQQLLQTQKKLNNSFLFGTKTQKYIDDQQEKLPKLNKTNTKSLSDIDQFCWKVNRMAEIVQYLYQKSQEHDEKIGSDNKRTEKLISQSFNRIEDKVNSHIESFTKTIHSFFQQNNEKVSQLQSNTNMIKYTNENKYAELAADMNKKVSQQGLKVALDAADAKIKKDLQTMLKNDHMQRLATVNQIKTSFKEVQKDLEYKSKVAAQKMQQMSQKVSKAMQVNAFEIEKHKIFDKLAELKSKTDDLLKKNNEFTEFRKNYLSQNQKINQQIIGVNQQIKKLTQKETSFKKIQNVTDLLKNFSPHLICQMTSQLKLHEAQLGKMQKRVVELQALRKVQDQKPMPQVNNGQNSDMIQKIIKEYMVNMDFEMRVKRSQKQIMEIKKRNDSFSQMEKKIHMLSKEIDVGAINKQLSKKSDQQNTRKDVKILDGKIQQLFAFFKQIRKDLDQKRKVAPRNDPFDNASLTTKKLMSPNCLSCTPSTPQTRRNYTRSKLQLSMDASLQVRKNTLYARQGK